MQHETVQNANVTNMTANATQEMVINLVPSTAEMPYSPPRSLISDAPFFEMAVAIAAPIASDKAASAVSTMLTRIAPLPMTSRLSVRMMMHDMKDRPEKPAPRT